MNKPDLRITRPRAMLVQGRADWYRISNKAGESPEIYIYDEIGYWGVTASDFVKDLVALDAQEITVHINSPGGEVYDGLAIYQGLKAHKATVTTVVDGVAASAASFIAMAGDKVVMAPKATMMIHDALTMSVGNAKDLRETADLLDKTSDNIASIYSDKSGQPVDFWRDLMRAETWYDADEAVAAGLADEVQGQVAKIDNQFDLSIFNYSGRAAAPAPVIKPPEPPVVDEIVPVVKPEPPERPEPFEWDFAALQSALRRD